MHGDTLDFELPAPSLRWHVSVHTFMQSPGGVWEPGQGPLLEDQGRMLSAAVQRSSWGRDDGRQAAKLRGTLFRRTDIGNKPVGRTRKD